MTKPVSTQINEQEALASKGEGRIHFRLSGKTVQSVMSDGNGHLVIRATTGEEVWIRWNDETGEPEFVKMDCRVVLPVVKAAGGVGAF